MRYILHLINVYVIEDVPFCPGLVGTVVKLIQEKILTMQLPADVTLVAFDVLMDFVDLYDFVKRDSKNVARELVLALSRYVDTLINAGKLAQTYPLIVQAYDCMIKWILISQWIIDDRDCYKAVIATLSKGITIFEREDAVSTTSAEPVNVEKKKRRETGFPPTKQLFQLPPRGNKSHQQDHSNQQPASSTSNPNSRNSSAVRKKEEVAVRMAAEYCMSQLVNHLGQFVAFSKQETIDDTKQLKELLASERETISSSIRFFLIDKRTILTLIDNTKKSTEDKTLLNSIPSIVLVIRDTTGRYVWSMEAKYKEDVLKKIQSNDQQQQQQLVAASTFLKPPTEAKKMQKPVTVPTATAVNEKELPTLDKVFVPGSDSWRQWDAVKSLMEQQIDPDHALTNNSKSESRFLHSYQVSPTCSNVDADSSRAFRLFLSQIGFLLPQNRHHITPLHSNETLIAEMEKLDRLNERDCISISAYYATSGNVSWKEIVETPPALSQQFLQFINCLGWPIDLQDHKGYKGKLDKTLCDKIPYHSDRTVEFVVNVPYFLKEPKKEMGSEDEVPKTISSIHQDVSSDDHVCVIWIEDLSEYKRLAKLIKISSAPQSRAMVYIFINPLKHSADSLYWIRILIPSFDTTPQALLASQRLYENALIFGPLVDGIVVSRHALGSMVRSTAISAHQACRVVTDTYTRPYVIRKEYIEEMAHRHRVKLPLSEFYTDIFTEKAK
ncbi:Ral GTPase-activating protein subunit alpha-2 [Choanephora cucurbitarum]|uniref:Ral GTPase-activating protein subunit alpha-2 n=1 Tax=Choanephora cucurbitarum TaxID=101091 RepID=A0A1C7N253_9FUNG|nr:Ral GTPase-activating protein subunit alpha-2 [Choanephora cucurbitarum]